MANTKEYQKEYMKKYWKEHPEKYKEHLLKMRGKKKGSEWWQKKKEVANQMNMCVKCFKRPRSEGHVWCEECRTYWNMKMKEKRVKMASMGICTKCFKKPVVKGRTCDDCKIKANIYYKKYHGTK